MIEYLPDLLAGLKVSAQVTAVALIIGLPLGLSAAIALGSSSRALHNIVVFVVEVGRGLPALVVLQIFYFGLPLHLSSFVAAAIGLGLTTAAYSSEIFRGGLLSVPAGEIEAGKALAMPTFDNYRFVIIPQAVRIAIPALMGFSITIFQGSALAYTIALPELLSVAYSIGARTFEYLQILTLAGLLYAVIAIPAAWLARRVERRLSRHVVRA
jgi:polar amino acid transport system permease protein